jgi:glucose-1-phosphate adenylyltransferase
MNSPVAFILAGGAGKRLSLLTRFRAKPAVPFAGRYRIIDFTLTNCVRSGINDVYILTQYIARSLTRHIGIGKPWDLDRRKGGVHILHPRLGYQAADWYQGTADAIFQNTPVIKELDTDHILILSGDHVYHMDYSEFLRFHLASGKPASLAVVTVPPSLCSEFGIVTAAPDGTITCFEEKPEHSRSTLASMGIYIFDKEFLLRMLKKLRRRHSNLDFGKHVIPHLVSRRCVSAFRFTGYWLDIGTLKGYYRASLDLLNEHPRLKFQDNGVPVLTVPDDSPPLVVTKTAGINRSLVCNGCVVEGEITTSIVSPGVTVERGATVDNSIIFHDCIIGSGARVKNAIIDKSVVIGRNASIGFGDSRAKNRLQPSYLDFGISLIGGKTRVPTGIRIGTNCLVCGSSEDGSIPKDDITDGESCITGDVTL